MRDGQTTEDRATQPLKRKAEFRNTDLTFPDVHRHVGSG